MCETIKFLKSTNYKKILQKTSADPSVGIKLSNELGIYIAQILPSPGTVNPHFHKNGDELYFILEGSSTMHIGKPVQGSGGQLISNYISKHELNEGDSFIVKAGEVHCLKNNSKEKNLTIAFICPKEHMDDSKDRTFVKNTP